MRIEAGTDAHYVLVAIQHGSFFDAGFFDRAPASMRFLYRSIRRAVADLIASGLVAQDGGCYALSDEGECALRRIVDTGYFSTWEA